jgi:hypothetical protein
MYWWFTFKLRQSGHARGQLQSIDAYMQEQNILFYFPLLSGILHQQGQRGKPSISTV